MATKKITYAEAFTELESILEKIEGEDLDVDNLASQVKRAAELIKFCKGKLRDTEEEIRKVIDEMESEQE
jgi:exodeoxyribonuclease VII small subunit